MKRYSYTYQPFEGVELPVKGNNLREAMISAIIHPFGNLLARDKNNNKVYIVAKREEGYRWKVTPESANVLEL